METNKPTEDWNNPAQPRQENKKVVSGVLAILLGSLGIHKFILGYKTEGIIMLAITVCTCFFGSAITGLIGLIEGIIYLTKSDEEFYQTYQVNKKGWF
jgi:TM2 domain-containing membrane protein YozV